MDDDPDSFHGLPVLALTSIGAIALFTAFFGIYNVMRKVSSSSDADMPRNSKPIRSADVNHEVAPSTEVLDSASLSPDPLKVAPTNLGIPEVSASHEAETSSTVAVSAEPMDEVAALSEAELREMIEAYGKTHSDLEENDRPALMRRVRALMHRGEHSAVAASSGSASLLEAQEEHDEREPAGFDSAVAPPTMTRKELLKSEKKKSRAEVQEYYALQAEKKAKKLHALNLEAEKRIERSREVEARLEAQNSGISNIAQPALPTQAVLMSFCAKLSSFTECTDGGCPRLTLQDFAAHFRLPPALARAAFTDMPNAVNGESFVLYLEEDVLYYVELQRVREKLEQLGGSLSSHEFKALIAGARMSMSSR